MYLLISKNLWHEMNYFDYEQLMCVSIFVDSFINSLYPIKYSWNISSDSAYPTNNSLSNKIFHEYFTRSCNPKNYSPDYGIQ